MATKSQNIGMILPHKFQKVGWWTLAASFLILLLIIFDERSGGAFTNVCGSNVFMDFLGPILGIAPPILANITLFLLCLSSEKEEDEYVMHIRMGIIKQIACYWFIISLIESLLFFFAGRLIPISSFSIMSLVFRPLTDIYILALVYIIWLKIKLYRIRKEAEND